MALARARAFGGYDGALGAGLSTAVAEVKVIGPLSAIADFGYVSAGGEISSGAGARWQPLSQDRHGLDGSLVLQFRPNDFQKEGNVLALVALGRGFGRARVTLNVLAGGDPEGDDAALEFRLATTYAVVGRLAMGLDGRWRVLRSIDEKRPQQMGTSHQGVFGPLVSYGIGPLALLASAGVAAATPPPADVSSPPGSGLRPGLFAGGGVGAVF